MSNQNRCDFTGNLTRDPHQGNGVLSFDIAVNKKSADKEYTEYPSIKLFGKVSESLAPYLKKGTKVRVSSEYRMNKQEVDGNTRYYPEFVVNDFKDIELL